MSLSNNKLTCITSRMCHTCSTFDLRRKRSYSASSSSDSGSSFEAATRHSRGTGSRSFPLSNKRSFKMVKSVFRIALLALNTSSMKATSACNQYSRQESNVQPCLTPSTPKLEHTWGRYPSVERRYMSRSRARMERGPNSSSGTEKRVSSLSKYPLPCKHVCSRRESSDFAVPGGPRNRICSPHSAARSIKRASVSRSTSPSVN